MKGECTSAPQGQECLAYSDSHESVQQHDPRQGTQTDAVLARAHGPWHESQALTARYDRRAREDESLIASWWRRRSERPESLHNER